MESTSPFSGGGMLWHTPHQRMSRKSGRRFSDKNMRQRENRGARMSKFQNILETVGNTPVVRINRLAPPA